VGFLGAEQAQKMPDLCSHEVSGGLCHVRCV
jgi:hypothetical protein